MVNDDMARVDRQAAVAWCKAELLRRNNLLDRTAVLAEYEAERLRCNNLLERPAGDMRRPTRVFETALVERVADESLEQARERLRPYSDALRAQEEQPLGTEADEVALVERTQRIRDASAADLGHYVALYAELCADQVRCPHPSFVRRWPADAHHSEVDYDGVLARDARELAEDMEWLAADAPREVNYKKAVSKDSTIEEMWAKMEQLGIMRD